MPIEQVKIADILRQNTGRRDYHERRTRDAEQIRSMVAAYRAGWKPEPMTLDCDLTVCDGNHRLAMFIELGVEQVACFVYPPRLYGN